MILLTCVGLHSFNDPRCLSSIRASNADNARPQSGSFCLLCAGSCPVSGSPTTVQLVSAPWLRRLSLLRLLSD